MRYLLPLMLVIDAFAAFAVIRLRATQFGAAWVGALVVLCGVLFVADFTYHKHGHFAVENVPGFYAICGFIMFTALILAAKTLRIFTKRPENYYGKAAVDSEDYPAAQLEKVDHDGA